MSLTRIFGVVAALVAAAGATEAQTKVALAKPDAEYSEGFTSITAIRELASGKVLVADRQDKVVQLVDLIAGSAVKVGREGSGPGEYALPMTLLALPDGSTLVQDPLNRRFLTITAEGKPGVFADMPRPPATAGSGSGPGPVMMLGGMEMRGTDSKGRLYFQGSPFSVPGAPPLDSVPILRWDRVNPGFDTIGYLKLPPGGAQSSASGGAVRMMFGMQKRFAPTETWTVAGDGRIARVLPSPYRVIWMEGPSRISAGPAQPYTPIRVTEADKELVREAMKKARPMTMTVGGPVGGGGGGGGGTRIAAGPGGPAPELEFEETMPPFEGRGGGSVLATPDGEVWVLRNRPASDKTPSYDVFDRTGALVKKVTLNKNSRVAGFGKGTVYVVRTDEDDLQYLQRYVKP